MTFYRQREAKNRMRKETGSEVLSEHAANTLIEIASRIFGDLICRFEGRQAFRVVLQGDGELSKVLYVYPNGSILLPAAAD